MLLPGLWKVGRALPDSSSPFFDYKLNISERYLRVLIFVSVLINLLLLIPDLLLIGDGTKRLVIVTLRLTFSSGLLLLLFRHRRISSFRTLALVVTACEFFALLIFLYVITLYSSPDFTIQALGLITLIIAFFFAPNRWGYAVGVAVLSLAAFLFCSSIFIPSASPMELWAAAFYASIIIFFCALSSLNTLLHQYREFLTRSGLEHIGSTDRLTNTANRYKMEEEAKRWIDFCQRQNLPLSLVFIDVDNLKRINDQHGHSAGDNVLSCLAKLIQSHLRSSDTLARWGGDEFVLLLPDTPLDHALSLTERLRMLIRKQAAEQKNGATCSFGVVEMKSDSDFETLLREADLLMYAGKKRGKDAIQWTGSGASSADPDIQWSENPAQTGAGLSRDR